jgi:hypothetical protein
MGTYGGDYLVAGNVQPIFGAAPGFVSNHLPSRSRTGLTWPSAQTNCARNATDPIAPHQKSFSQVAFGPDVKRNRLHSIKGSSRRL